MHAWLRALGVLVASVWLGTQAGAVTLYDNGPVNDGDSQGRCDSSPTGVCGGSTGVWTYYDDFRLTSDAIVTGFDYVDYFSGGGPADYVETVFSIYDGDPFSTAPVASGSAAAVIAATGPPDEFLFTVSGLVVALDAGDYWLGISNTLVFGATTTVARVADPGSGLDAAKQSDGPNDLDFPFGENRAFSIEGTPVPEPSSAGLLALGLILLAALRRPRA